VDNDKKRAVAGLLASAAAEDDPPREAVNVRGNNNIVGNGNAIVITERHVTVTRAEPRPGVEHITEDQVRRLHDLKDEIVRLEALTKRNPASHQRVWATFNKKMGIGSMRMLPKGKFAAGEKFLAAWVGRLTASRTAERDLTSEVAKRKLAYVRTNMKKLDCEERVRTYMEKNFGVRSTTQLENLEQIKRVYIYIAGIKKERGSC
jgi:hypothetical protein